MSEAPRVELNSTDLDFDLSAAAPSQFQQTPQTTPKKLQTANGTSAKNSSNTQNLQNSAIKAKDSILESKVRGTKRLRRCRDPS